MEPEYQMPPGSVAEPPPEVPSVGAAARSEGGGIAWEARESAPAPQFNLLAPRSEPTGGMVAAAAPAALTQGPEAGSVAAAARHRRLIRMGVAASLLLLVGGTVAFIVVVQKMATPWKTPVAAPAPTTTPSVSPSVAPTFAAMPSSSPPSPSATPAPQTVTAPSVTPTPDHPQVVTVKSKSGLWLRSSASSVSRSNIVGWMPPGAQVSVDGVGAFWWHGTYKGVTGYFASSYTQ